MKDIKTVNDIFELFGGSAMVAHILGLHQYTVDRMRTQGIATKYWDKLIKANSNLCPAILFSASKKAKQRSKK